MKINPSKNLYKIFKFLKEIKMEIKRVNWPGAKESLKYTAIVIAASIVLAVFMGGIDFLFSLFLNKFVL